MEVRWIFRIIGTADKVSSEDSDVRARWRIGGKTGMDTAAEEMSDGNK